MDRNSLREAVRRANALRDEFQQRGDGFFRPQEFRAELSTRLHDLTNAAYDAFVDYVAERIDRERKDRSDSRQPTFPGFDLDGEYHVNGGRISKPRSQLQHFQAAIAQDQANLANVLEANARKAREFAMLLPYWRAGMTKMEVVQAYLAANPPEPDHVAGEEPEA
jgi:hypothetical protein